MFCAQCHVQKIHCEDCLVAPLHQLSTPANSLGKMIGMSLTQPDYEVPQISFTMTPSLGNIRHHPEYYMFNPK
jgi:hypothetical protein